MLGQSRLLGRAIQLRHLAAVLVLAILLSETSIAVAAETPEAALNDYMAARANAIRGGGSEAALSRISPTNPALKSFVERDLAELRRYLNSFRNVVDRAQEHQIVGRQGLTFTVYEKATVRWQDAGFRPSMAVIPSSVGYAHIVTLESGVLGYRVATDAFRGIGWDSPDAKVASSVTPTAAAERVPRPRGLASPAARPLGATGTYNRSAATSYAHQWAYGRNSAYPDFGNLDCTNFVSQAFYAGGQVMGPESDSNGWWHNSSTHATGVAWRYSMTHESWMKFTGQRAYTAGSANILNFGDVIYYDWNPADGVTDHTVIVIGFDGSNQPYVAMHSPNLDFAPWASWMASWLIPYTPRFMGMWDTFTY